MDIFIFYFSVMFKNRCVYYEVNCCDIFKNLDLI